MYHSIIVSEAIRGYLPLLCRFLSGERGGLRQEKLSLSKDHWLYSLRVNKSTRLLYTLMNVNGKRTVVVVGEVVSHDYHKSRFLRASGVLETYLGKHREWIEMALRSKGEGELYEPVLEQDVMSEEMIDEPVLTDYYPLKAFGAQLYFEDSMQEACSRQSQASTVIIYGASGTGKTVSAMLYLASHAGALRSDGAAKRFLYVTLQPDLVQIVRAKLATELSAEQLSSIDFSTYAELLQRNGERRDVASEEVFDFIAHWLRRLTKKTIPYTAFGEARSAEEAAKVIHHEWTLIAGLRELNAYLSLGIDQSYIKEKEVRRQVYEQYELFKSSLNEYEVYLPFHCLPERSERYNGVIVDETFLLSFANVSSLCAWSDFAMLLCDSHQAIGGHWLSILSSRQQGGVQPILLRENHRNPNSVIEILNRVLKVKFHIRPGLRDKYEQGQISTSSVSTTDDLLWIDKAWWAAHQETVHQWGESREFAVLILCDEDHMSLSHIAEKKQRAREIFNTPLILTRKEAQGLEYPYVAVLLDESIFLLANELKRGFTSELMTQSAPTTRAAAKGVTWSQQKAMNVSNQLYVGFSRAQRQLIIYVDEHAAKAQELLTYYKGEVQTPTSVSVIEASSQAEWIEEARRQAALGNESVAEAIKQRQVKKNQPDASPSQLSQMSFLGGAPAAVSSVNVPSGEKLVFSTSSVENVLAPPNNFNEKWVAFVKQFTSSHPQKDKIFTKENIKNIFQKKNVELINWVVFVAEVEAGKGESIFINFLKINKLEEFFEGMAECWDKITPLGLNYLSKSADFKNMSLAYRVLADEAMLKGAYPHIIGKLNQETLNTIIHFPVMLQGTSAVFWLCSSKLGLEIINQNPHLIRIMQVESLNHVIPQATGRVGGKSATYQLCTLVEGQALLKKYPELVSKIRKNALNFFQYTSCTQVGEGFSALFMLCLHEADLIILYNHPSLINEIGIEAFNARLPSEAAPLAGQSVVYLLSKSQGGRAILARYPRLVEMITSDALNWILPESAEDEAGFSPLYHLCRTESGQSLLFMHPKLRAKICIETLKAPLLSKTHELAGKTCLDILASTDLGLTILQSSELQEKLRENDARSEALRKKSIFQSNGSVDTHRKQPDATSEKKPR